MELIKKTTKYLLLFLLVNMLFFFSLLLTYFLPKDRIVKNVDYSIGILEKEGLYFNPFYTFNPNLEKVAVLDNYTDSILLNVALDNNTKYTNIFKKTVLNTFYEKDKNQITNLKDVLNNDINSNNFYIRYWFGSEILLKPMLVFNDYSEIRYINMILMNIILILLCYLISKRIGFKFVIPFVLSLLFMNYTNISMSLQYSPVMYIMLISSIVVLMINNKKKQYYNYLFLLIGCSTAFFDLLTYPLITLGYPLIFYVITQYNNKNNFKKYYKQFLLLILLWGIGYGGTYLFKWAIASFVLGENCFKSAFTQLQYRLDLTGSDEITKIGALSKNVNVYFNKYTILLTTMFVIVLGVFVKIRKFRINKIKIYDIIPLLMILISPYLWYLILTNHSYIHCWMTYKIQGICLFSLLSIIMIFVNFDKRKDRVVKNEK